MKKIQNFLGFVKFYYKFIKDFFDIIILLVIITRKD
jgi:hypothetical protein